MSKSQLENDLGKVLSEVSIIGLPSMNIQNALARNDIGVVLMSLSSILSSVSHVHEFLDEYNDFLDLLQAKFGVDTMDRVSRLRKVMSSVSKDLDQLKAFVSENKWSLAQDLFKATSEQIKNLANEFGVLVAQCQRLDYSKLDNRAWKLIGIPGIHYRSRVFLSYKYRHDDPRKDENQQMVDNYVKPVLGLLHIDPVTARSHLKAQQYVDDDTIQLVEDCDAIIGFYTQEDDLSNVDYELSHNDNIVAIFREVGARTPSMRLSKLQVKFRREEMGDLVIQVIKALADKGLFRLVK